MKKPIIVGYDPGTTAAVAVIDTRGNIIFIKSKKGLNKSEIINKITEIGKPIIVAADRRPLPRSVDKLAKTLSSRVFYPTKSLSASEKWELAKEYDKKIKNDHERDALAAALKAYKMYSGLFRKTRSTLNSLGLIQFYSDVLIKLISEEAENLTEAIGIVLSEKREEKPKEVVKEVVGTKEKELMKTIEKLQQELQRREKDVLILQKFNENLKNKLNEALDKIKKYESGDKEAISRNVRRLKKELKIKDSIIEQLKMFRKIENKGLIPILELNEINVGIVENLHKSFDLKDKVLISDSIKDAQILNEYDIKALITSKEIDEKILEKINFPIINIKDISIKELNDYKVVEAKEFEEKLKSAKKIGFIQWVKGHKKRRF